MTENYIYLKPNQIEIPTFNFKLEDAAKQECLKAVIKKRGQIIPIQVMELKNGSYQLITGRKVLQVLLELEINQIYCYNHGKIDSHKAKLIALETDLQNYETNTVGLADIIEELVVHYDIQELVKTIPLTQSEIISYTDYLKFDWYKEEFILNERRKVTADKKKKKEAAKDRTAASNNPAFKPMDVDALLQELINV